MQRFVFLLAMALSLAMVAMAQPDPNAQQGQGQQPGNRGFQGAGMFGGQTAMVMEVLPQGVFVLRSGVLAKFAANTLENAGTLELFGAMPAQPNLPQNPTQQDREAMRNWMTQNMQRLAPATMLEKGGRLYIVIGTNCFCVDAATMKQLGNKVDLSDPAAAQNNRMLGMMSAPTLKLEGNVLYVALGQELVTVGIDTGKVLNRAKLPQELFPTMQMGGGRNNAAGAGGDAGQNRNNRRGQNREAQQ